MSLTIALAMAGLATMVDPQPADLTVRIANVRSGKGVVHACLTRNPRHFPDCRTDPLAVRSTVPATAGLLHFPALPSGRYAVTLFHDENRNQRLDMVLGVPREGFGFSGNPRIRFGAPRFREVTIAVPPGQTDLIIRMQYLL
ncbi:MAG TPA: DUF2141 domain-containing protein [Sphingomicrobium sp.]|nr:DUF2141 domain-containing protein [Sphingomicrobium sp.]